MSKWLGKHEPVQPEEWTAKYTGYKKARYQRAIREWDASGVNRKHSYVSAFVKAEKLLDPRKDPRMIQARNPVYNVALGNYLKAIEHKLYNIGGTRHLRKLFPAGRLIAKGLNMNARGALVARRWNELNDPVALELDCSRFDAHCSPELLRVEHRVYLDCFTHAKELDRLLKWQIQNKCFTEGGVRYTCDGRRMSGDMNTALGNCVLMLLMLGDAMQQLGVKPHQFGIIDDGDDCVLIVERSVSDRVIKGLPGLFNGYGHTLKVESQTDEFEKVTLCGARVIRVGGVRKCILNPRRVIGKARLILGGKNIQAIEKYVATVGQCLLALHSGVPILQAHACMLRRASRRILRGTPGSYLYRLGWDQEWRAEVPTEITEQARLDFELAFGIKVEDQLYVENWFNSHDPFEGGEYGEIDCDDSIMSSVDLDCFV